MNNKQIYIMNGMELCGIGMPGELCIAGEGIARGYLNRPELTAEKFIDNPFGEGKLYRTGDLARWLPDGNIEYLGRIDEQVKIRGFRIELGEIESVLRTLNEIKDCAVIARNDASGEKAIYAYLVSDEEISLSAVRDRLSASLPEYMIPSYMGQIEEIPVTKNGKLDKKALPEIDLRSKREYIATATDEEAAVAQVFGEILGTGNIGANDDFFEMGGDSIKAIRVVSKLRERGYELSVMDLMQAKTPRMIAPRLRTAEVNRYEQGEVNGIVPLTPIQREFFGLNYPAPSHYNQAIMLFKQDGFDVDALRTVLDKLVSHHDVLRSVFCDGKQTILSVKESKMYDLYEYVISDCDGYEKQIEKMCEEIQASISLENGPLVKVGLFHTGNGDHILLCVHHLVIDGVSWRIFLEDFVSAYTQLQSSGTITLPNKTASFKEWAENINDYANSDEIKSQEAYWDNVVSVMKPIQTGTEFSQIHIELTCEDTSTLVYDAPKAYGTEINDLLIAALGMAYRRWTGRSEMTVDLEGHGREQVGKHLAIDRTVGWFTTVYPIRVVAEDGAERTITGTKEMLRKVPNHGIGYGILRYINGRYGNMHSEISFNYLGHFDGEASRMNGIDVSSISYGATSNAANKPHNAINLNGGIAGNRLGFAITYDSARYTMQDMESFGALYVDAVKEIISLCLNTKAGQESKIRDFLDESIAPYLKNYKNGMCVASYKPLFMQNYLLAEHNNVICDMVKINGDMETSLCVVKSIVDTQSVFRTVYNNITKQYEEYECDEWNIPVLSIGGHCDIDAVFHSFAHKVADMDIVENGELLSIIFLVEMAKDEYYMVYAVHHGIWDRNSSEMIKAKVTDVISGSAQNDNFSYAQYCNSIASTAQEYDFSDDELAAFSEIQRSISNGIESINKICDPTIASDFSFELSEKKMDIITKNPLEAMMTISSYLLYGENSGNMYPFGMVHHNRNEQNSEILGLVLDYFICLFNPETKQTLRLAENAVLPFSERFEQWVKRYGDISPDVYIDAVPSINYTGVFSDRNPMPAEENRPRVKYFESNYAHKNISIAFTIVGNKLAGTMHGYRLDEAHMHQAIDFWSKANGGNE